MEKEFDKELLKEVEETISEGEHYKKDVTITGSNDQLDAKIPKKITETLGLKKGDKFRFHLIPKGDTFKLELEIIKND